MMALPMTTSGWRALVERRVGKSTVSGSSAVRGLRGPGLGPPDRDDLEIVDEPRREDAARVRIGLQVEGDVEASGGGQRGQGVALGEAERRGEGGQARAARGVAHGLPLLVAQAGGKSRRQGIIQLGNHASVLFEAVD